MKRRSRKRNLFSNILAFLMLMVMVLLALPITGLNFASADTYISGRQGSIQTILMSQPDANGNQTPYTGINMKLYQVGTASENNGVVSFILDSRFASSGIKMEALTTADKWAAAAQTLAGMAGSSGLNAIEGTSDAQGQIFFNNLEQGVYLLVQSSAQDHIIISPSLFTMPLQENGQWIYDIKTYPKFTPDNAKADISVTKRLYSVTEDSKVIPLSADDATFKIGLYTDKEGTIPFRDDYERDINIKGTTSGTAVWKDVPTGSYYVFELDENGKPVEINQLVYVDDENSWMYNVKDENENENNQVIVSKSGSSGNMYVDNYFYYLPHGYYQNCTIKISKNVLKDGKKVSTDDTFYAGIFEKDSEGDPILISNVELEQNGTVEVNIELSDEELPEEITYIVKETDEDGEPVNKKDFPYTVSGEGSITLKESEGYEGTITLTNSQSTVTPTPVQPTNPPSQNNTYQSSNSSVVTHQTVSTNVKSPKTGDDTPIILWIVILVAAAAGGTFVVYRINKKNR